VFLIGWSDVLDMVPLSVWSVGVGGTRVGGGGESAVLEMRQKGGLEERLSTEVLTAHC